MHAHLKDWIPPIVAKSIVRLRTAPNAPPDYEYLPAGWPDDDAGWDTPSIVDHYRKGWDDFVASQEGTQPLLLGNRTIADHNGVLVFNYALAQAAHLKTSIAMLDYGGGMGHYSIRAHAAMPDVEIEYFCRDVPILVAAGRVCLPTATFYTDDACFDRAYDFVLASSSLQYARDWKAAAVRLAGVVCPGGYLLITRAPLHEAGPAYVFRQRAYNTAYAAWSLNKRELVKCAQSAGVSLVREFWVNDSPEPIAGAPSPSFQRGLLFQRPA